MEDVSSDAFFDGCTRHDVVADKIARNRHCFLHNWLKIQDEFSGIFRIWVSPWTNLLWCGQWVLQEALPEAYPPFLNAPWTRSFRLCRRHWSVHGRKLGPHWRSPVRGEPFGKEPKYLSPFGKVFRAKKYEYTYFENHVIKIVKELLW